VDGSRYNCFNYNYNYSSAGANMESFWRGRGGGTHCPQWTRVSSPAASSAWSWTPRNSGWLDRNSTMLSFSCIFQRNVLLRCTCYCLVS